MESIRQMFSNALSRIVPVVKASDEEPADPQEELREKCGELPKCVAFRERYEECNNRVNSRKKTAETCEEEVIDLMHCIDHCVAKTLFTRLK